MIKKYWEFIRESLKEDIDDGKFWKLNENDIREFLIDLDDEKYLITITFGFVGEKESYNRISEVFTEKVISGDGVIPAYWVQIETSRNTSSVDVTDSILFSNDIIKGKIDSDISFHDADGELDINNIQLKGGLWIGEDESEQLEAKEYISMFIKQKDTVKITQKQVADYYGLVYDKEDKSDNIYIHVDLEDMAYSLLNSNDDYQDTLVGGTEYMWDRYESHYYIPDTQGFFQYSLDTENESLMVKSIIKEGGGLKEIINHIGDECDDMVYDDVKEMSEDNLVNYLLKERFYSTLDQLCKNSEIAQESKQIVADWEMGAHVDTVYSNILSEFDSKVDEHFNYKKIDIDSWVKSEHYSNGGYTQSITYYEVMFENRWMDDLDSDDLFGESSIRNVYVYWCGQQRFSETLNPRIPDWGNADDKGINSDIKHLLTNFLT
jgi:hypothetical protein